MIRLAGSIALGAMLGLAFDLAVVYVVLTFGPETLLHAGDAVYGPDGQYLGIR